MAHFLVQIQASAVYLSDAPTLSVLVNGTTVATGSVSARLGLGSDTLDFMLEYDGDAPTSLQFSFNDSSIEVARTITISSVKINGAPVDTTYISMLLLAQGQNASLNIAATSHLYGRQTITADDLGGATQTGSSGDDRIKVTEGDSIVTGGSGNDRIVGASSDTAIFGGAGNDTIFGGAANDILVGDEGDDNLYGEGGDDIIHGGLGNDTINGGVGHDLINGGENNDTLFGDDGNDIIYGESGNDTITGGVGDDILYGDDGEDIITGGIGNDILYGGADADQLYGAAGDDSLYGDDGDDQILAGAGNDTLQGGAGNDTLQGGVGNDTIYGDDDNDIINGGGGNDILNGGAGNDTAIYTGSWSNYTISLNAGIYTIIHNSSGTDGTDTATLIESFQFSNGIVTAANLVNIAPVGTATSLTTIEDNNLVLATGHFGYTDANNLDALSSVRIDSLPSAGTLLLSGVSVIAGQVITVANIAAGNLVFVPVADATGTPYTSFTFSVRDLGGLFDTSPKTLTINVTNTNDAPVITSNGGGDTATVNIAEGNTAVTTVIAADPDVPTTLTYSISGGLDAARFNINSATGILSFISAQNFESPTDSNADNIYVVNVSASDGSLNDTQIIYVTVTNVNESPLITSNGGGATTSISINENSTAVTTVTATDPDAGSTLTYSISGGVDAAWFAINASTGALSFATAPNYELPTDAGNDNVYDVRVRVSDGSLYDEQDIAISVNNVNEGDVGNTTGTASTITINGSVVSAVDTGGDRDWYGISLTAGVKYAIWARGTPTEGGTMTDPRIHSIRNASGTSVNSGDDDGGVGYDSLLYYTPTTSGTYYIEMGAYGASQTGTYTLSVFLGGNTYTGTTGGNTLTGSANADYLEGLAGNDTLTGGAGNDILDGGNNDDILIGGDGDDILLGGSGADIFRFTSFVGVDTVVDFTVSQNDVLDISNLLTGFTAGVSDIDDFLQFQTVGSDTIVRIDANGTTGGVNFVQIATLSGETGLNVQSLYDAGRIDAV
ncbi:MAG: cadherin domain-containing protein [Micavibrio sp.]